MGFKRRDFWGFVRCFLNVYIFSATSQANLYGELFPFFRITPQLRFSVWIRRSTTPVDLSSSTGAKRFLKLLDLQKSWNFFLALSDSVWSRLSFLGTPWFEIYLCNFVCSICCCGWSNFAFRNLDHLSLATKLCASFYLIRSGGARRSLFVLPRLVPFGLIGTFLLLVSKFDFVWCNSGNYEPTGRLCGACGGTRFFPQIEQISH